MESFKNGIEKNVSARGAAQVRALCAERSPVTALTDARVLCWDARQQQEPRTYFHGPPLLTQPLP